MQELPSETYCRFPFIHICSLADGTTKPCGIADSFDDGLNLNEHTIEEVYNSRQMKQLRKDMLEGVRNKVCNVCYRKDDAGEYSTRQLYNDNRLWEHPVVNEDYSVDSIQHFDIRFSNLCNFTCRMCDHGSSSNWYDAYKVFGFPKPTSKVIKLRENILEDLIPHMKNIKSFYFAGGEPLIMPEHNQIIKWLYENLPIDEDAGCRQLRLHYNTNLSILKFESTDLIKMWKGFKRVFLSISCDGVHEVGEYQRTGWNHDIFVENMNTIKKSFGVSSTRTGDKKNSSELIYNFQYTTTIWNMHHIFDFIKFMKKNKYIKTSENIDFTYAWSPDYCSINNFEPNIKEEMVKLFKKNMRYIKSEKTKAEFNGILKFMNTESTAKPEYVKDCSKKMDILRAPIQPQNINLI
jgi:uncharacterized Fe-S cluster-containing radical SAM superfamily protein